MDLSTENDEMTGIHPSFTINLDNTDFDTSHLANRTLHYGNRQLEKELELARVDHEMKMNSATRQIRKYQDECHQLQTETNSKSHIISRLEERNTYLSEKLQQCLSDQEVTNRQLMEENQTLKVENNNLKLEYDKIKMENMGEISCLKSDLSISQLDKEQTVAECKVHLQQIQEYKSVNEKLESEIAECMDLKSKLKELQAFKDDFEEKSILLKNLKQRYENFPEIIKEYDFLKERRDNYLLLQERYEDIKNKYERIQNIAVKLGELEAENAELKLTLNVLKNTETNKYLSMDDLIQQVTRLQKTEALLLSNQSSLQTCVNSQADKINKLEDQNADLNENLSKLEASNAHLQSKQRGIERKLAFIRKERDTFRELLDSFENEATVMLPTQSLQAGAAANNLIKELETQNRDLQVRLDSQHLKLEEAFSRIQHLQNSEKGKSLTGSGSPVIASTNAAVITQLREQICSLEQKVETLTEEKVQIQLLQDHHTNQGALDQRSTKVLQLVDNPANLRKIDSAKQLGELKEENMRLKERVRLLEQSESQQDLTIRIEKNVIELSAVNQQLSEMEEKAKSAELKNQRLIEVFKKTTSDFRKVYTDVTGYEMEITPDSNYRVTHIHATSRDHFLLFKLSSTNGVQLLHSPYCDSLSTLMDRYLAQYGSLPGFMNALGLELFNNHVHSTSVA